MARALVQFEAAAFDIASTHGGWVVKLIGDAAMFEARDPVAAARIGLDLCHAVDECVDLPGARGGLAHGLVQARDGDYFGTVVNLAARAAGVSEPFTLAVNDVVADRLAIHLADHLATDGRSSDDDDRRAAWAVDPMPPHDLRGFDEPPPLYRLSRSG